MGRTSNIDRSARRIRDKHHIPLTAAKAIARALTNPDPGRLELLDSFIARAAARAREQGGKITVKQAAAAMAILIPDGAGIDYTELQGVSDAAWPPEAGYVISCTLSADALGELQLRTTVGGSGYSGAGGDPLVFVTTTEGADTLVSTASVEQPLCGTDGDSQRRVIEDLDPWDLFGIDVGERIDMYLRREWARQHQGGGPSSSKFLEHIYYRISLRYSPERIAAQWKANRDVQPSLTLGQFQAPLGERLVVTGTAGTGKSYALRNMLMTLCSEHGPEQVQLLIGEAWLPAVGEDFADLPHAIGVFAHLEIDQAPFLRKLRSELAKRLELWRLYCDQGDDRYMKLPALIVVIDGFAHASEMPDGLLRALDRIRGFCDNAMVLMTQHEEGAQRLTGGAWHRLHFGSHLGWMDQTLRERLGSPQVPFFARGLDGGRVAIHTVRAPDVFPATTPSVSRVVESPRFDDTLATVVAAGIRAATAVKQPRAEAPTPRADSPEVERYVEGEVPRRARIHDVFFPGLAVRTVIGIANDPEAALAGMDLPALVPEHAPGDDVLVVAWFEESMDVDALRACGGDVPVSLRAFAVGGVDAVAVEEEMCAPGIGVRRSDDDRVAALWRALARREPPARSARAGAL